MKYYYPRLTGVFLSGSQSSIPIKTEQTGTITINSLYAEVGIPLMPGMNRRNYFKGISRKLGIEIFLHTIFLKNKYSSSMNKMFAQLCSASVGLLGSKLMGITSMQT